MKVFKLFALLLLLVFTSITCAPRADAPKEDKKSGPIVVTGPLQKRVKACLDLVKSRDLETTHNFWAIFHGILGMGFETTLFDRDAGKKVNAIDYICQGGKLTGMKFTKTADGLDVLITPGIGTGQGHQDQFIAEMGQWGMPADKEFIVDGKKYTFLDFCKQSKAQASVKTDQELTWAIVIIAQYFPELAKSNEAWTNNRGEKLTFEDVVRYELNEPIGATPTRDPAACGGTHRLFGLTWAYHLHLLAGGKTTGVWKDVVDKLELYKNKAHEYQNPDGTFSKNYVSGKEPGKDLGSCGHVLEWLALVMTDEELKQPWVEEAVNAVVQLIFDRGRQEVETGELYHAAHGLHIYYNRVFGPLGKHEPMIPLRPR